MSVFTHDALLRICEELPRCTETKNMSAHVGFHNYNFKFYVSFVDEDGIDYDVWSGLLNSRDDEDEAVAAIREFLNPEQESPCKENTSTMELKSRQMITSSCGSLQVSEQLYLMETCSHTL